MKPTIFSLLVLLFLTSCGSEPSATATSENEETNTSYTNALDNPAVTTGPLETRTISHEIACSGRIEVPPTDLIAVHSPIAGQVSDLRYLTGDYVKKGALLMQVFNPDLIGKQRQLLETKASLEIAQKELDRQQLLAGGEATTASKLDAATGQLALLKATYQGLKSELKSIGIAVQRLEDAGEFQSTINLYARGNGFVHEVNTNQGQMVSPTDQLMELAGTEHLHLELAVPAREISWIKKGQQAAFELPFSAVSGTARIEKINPMVDESSGMLQVHCHFLAGHQPEELLPGLLINARITAGNQALTGLPRSAIVKEGTTYFAFRVTANDGFEKIALEAPIVSDDFVAFTTEPGSTWVTGGAYYLEGSE